MASYWGAVGSVGIPSHPSISPMALDVRNTASFSFSRKGKALPSEGPLSGLCASLPCPVLKAVCMLVSCHDPVVSLP